MLHKPGYGASTLFVMKPAKRTQTSGIHISNVKEIIQGHFDTTADRYFSRDLFRNQSGKIDTAENELDAMRHAWSAAEYHLFIGDLGIAVANAFETLDENRGHRTSASAEMDRRNNLKGAEINKKLTRSLRRTPTSDERMVAVLDALLSGELVVDKPTSHDKWRPAIQKQVREAKERIRQDRELRDWLDRGIKEGPRRPIERDRGWRDFERPGYSRGRTQEA